MAVFSKAPQEIKAPENDEESVENIELKETEKQASSVFISEEKALPPITNPPVDQEENKPEENEESQIRMPHFVEDTLVSRQKTFAFEEALQELFLNAEMEESTGILISMKEIVLACKGITENVTDLENDHPKPNIIDSKASLSQALTKLMGVAKSHAAKPCAESLSSLHFLSSELTVVVENLVNSFSPSQETDTDQSFEDVYHENYNAYYENTDQNETENLRVIMGC